MDELLDLPGPSAVGHVDWVRQHQLRLQEARERAIQQLKMTAQDRAERSNQNAKDVPLQVGDLVYLINRVVGRNKIQDLWRPELHVIVSRPFGDQVAAYTVRPQGGGPTATYNRKDLKLARPPRVTDAGRDEDALRVDAKTGLPGPRRSQRLMSRCN